MILHYVFEDIMCDVQYDEGTHINNRWFEPHYHREPCVVEYDYDVNITFKDFFDYIKPYDFKNWKEDVQHAYEIGCRDVWNSTLLVLDELEKDEDFVQFMKDRYEDDAREQCQEEND